MTRSPTLRLLDTRDRSDATLCGYDRATDPHTEAEGVILTQTGEWFTLLTGDGEVKLHETEAKYVAQMMLEGIRAFGGSGVSKREAA